MTRRALQRAHIHRNRAHCALRSLGCLGDDGARAEVAAHAQADDRLSAVWAVVWLVRWAS